jgi:hypothetical protein
MGRKAETPDALQLNAEVHTLQRIPQLCFAATVRCIGAKREPVVRSWWEGP